MTLKQLSMVAIAAGVIMCLLIFFTLTSVEKSIAAEQPEPVAMEKIVVARSNIKRGEIIETSMLRTKEFATKSLPDGVVTDIRMFVGLPAKIDIFSGDIMTMDKVFTDFRQAGFIGMIPDNCRAITIPIDNITGVAGLINPGNYVDLVLVTQAENGATKAQVLLEDIMLLGIDKVVDRDMGEIDARNAEGLLDNVKSPTEVAGQVADSQDQLNSALNMANGGQAGRSENRKAPTGVSGGSATLALTTDQVLKIIAAKEVGSIHLVLRPLKPTSDAMYFKKTTEYFGEGESETINDTEVKEKTESVENIDQLQDQSPDQPKIQSLTQQSPQSKSSGAFEVIQWGN